MGVGLLSCPHPVLPWLPELENICFSLSPRSILETLGRTRGLLFWRSEKAIKASVSPKGIRREMGVKLILMVDRNKI